MIIYISLVGLILLFRLFFQTFGFERVKKFYLIIASLPIVLITALRHFTIGGNDPAFYYEHYQLSQTMSLGQFINATRMEYGYAIFVKVFSTFFSNPQSIFVISGILFMLCTGIFIYKNSSDFMMSLILYVTVGSFFFSLMGLRQTLAMSICLLSLELIKKRKLLLFLILVAVATSVHRTAIVFLPMYFIGFRKVNLKNNLLTLISVAIIMFSYNRIISFANVLFDSNYSSTVSSGGFVVIIIYLITIILSNLYKNKIFENKSNLIFYNMTMIGFVTYLLRYFGAQASERISFYFFYGVLILLTEYISSITNQKEKVLIYYLAITLAVLLYIYRLTNTPTLVPYKFYWL